MGGWGLKLSLMGGEGVDAKGLFRVKVSYQVAFKQIFFVAAGFSLRQHRLESLCHHLTATWYHTELEAKE